MFIVFMWATKPTFTQPTKAKEMRLLPAALFRLGFTEGAAFNCFSVDQKPDSSLAVVRYLDRNPGSHIYSTSAVEQSILDSFLNYLNEGIAWYGDLASLA